MNQKLEYIFRRRSVRSFTDEQVTDAQVEALLQAGMAAPSAVARDPWHFIVVRDAAGLKGIAPFMQACLVSSRAPMAIIVSKVSCARG